MSETEPIPTVQDGDDRRVVSIRHTFDEDERKVVGEKLKEAFDELGYDINWVYKTDPEYLEYPDGEEPYLDWNDAAIDLEKVDG